MKFTQCSHCYFNTDSDICNTGINRAEQGVKIGQGFYLNGECKLIFHKDQSPTNEDILARIKSIPWLMVYSVSAKDLNPELIHSIIETSNKSYRYLILIDSVEEPLLSYHKNMVQFYPIPLNISILCSQENKTSFILKSLHSFGKNNDLLFTPCVIQRDSFKIMDEVVLYFNQLLAYQPKTNPLFQVINEKDYSLAFVGTFLYEEEPICQYFDMQS